MANDIFLTKKDDIAYNMHFVEVLEELFDTENMQHDSAWFQGHQFKDGVFLALNHKRELHMYRFLDGDASPVDIGALKLSDDHYYQAYRRIQKTKADAGRK